MTDDPETNKPMTKEEAFSKWLNPMPELTDPRYYAGRDRRQRTDYAPQIVEEAVQVGQMEEPEPIEIPRFLAPDPLEGIPDALRILAEPGETIAQMQARLWELWREMNGKLMLNLASPEEIALHTRLHNELHWIAPPIEGEE